MVKHICAAVLGSPIDHSLSPQLHNFVYQALQLDAQRYRRFNVTQAQLANFLESHPDFTGFSMTMPLKNEAVRLADTLSWHVDETVRLSGSANTLVRSEEGTLLANTDVDGIIGAFSRATLTSPKRAAILGSGATAASATLALAKMGAREVSYFARNEQTRTQLSELARSLGMATQVAGLSCAEFVCVDAIVSTLPAGTVRIDDWQWPDDLTGTFVLDVAYAPGEFSTGKQAQQRGATVVPGSSMLVQQAAKQFEMFARAAGQPLSVPFETVTDLMYQALGE